uniref:Putative terminase small subunit n=1 Tax=viral metagenome TaxID=1070528 RepID=A0A6M3XQF4_9ZZZZ
MDNKGRPPKWSDPDALQQAVNSYFDHCLKTIIKVQHPHSKGITTVETPIPPTMAGLASWLNISRETLNQYHNGNIPGQVQAEDEENARKFSDIITRARGRIHANNVEMGMVGAYDNKINALNLASNFGYSTKQEISSSGGLSIEIVRFSDILGDGQTKSRPATDKAPDK